MLKPKPKSIGGRRCRSYGCVGHAAARCRRPSVAGQPNRHRWNQPDLPCRGPRPSVLLPACVVVGGDHQFRPHPDHHFLRLLPTRQCLLERRQRPVCSARGGTNPRTGLEDVHGIRPAAAHHRVPDRHRRCARHLIQHRLRSGQAAARPPRCLHAAAGRDHPRVRHGLDGGHHDAPGVADDGERLPSRCRHLRQAPEPVRRYRRRPPRGACLKGRLARRRAGHRSRRDRLLKASDPLLARHPNGPAEGDHGRHHGVRRRCVPGHRVSPGDAVLGLRPARHRWEPEVPQPNRLGHRQRAIQCLRGGVPQRIGFVLTHLAGRPVAFLAVAFLASSVALVSVAAVAVRGGGRNRPAHGRGLAHGRGSAAGSKWPAADGCRKKIHRCQRHGDQPGVPRHPERSVRRAPAFAAAAIGRSRQVLSVRRQATARGWRPRCPSRNGRQLGDAPHAVSAADGPQPAAPKPLPGEPTEELAWELAPLPVGPRVWQLAWLRANRPDSPRDRASGRVSGSAAGLASGRGPTS